MNLHLSLTPKEKQRARAEREFYTAAVDYAKVCAEALDGHTLEGIIHHFRCRERFINAYKLMVKE